MIKEKIKITKYNYKKPFVQIIKEFAMTVLYSLLFSALVTTCLSIHARNEMIKNYYTDINTKEKINKQLAIELIQKNPNILSDMRHKNYSICINIGKLFEIAGDYTSAETAYKFAIEKEKNGNYTAYKRLIFVLLEQNKIKEADDIINKFGDLPNKKLLLFKTRSNIMIGDKYYSLGKFISAAKYYEKADFYYKKFSKRDAVIEKSIENRILNSYTNIADYMVQTGHNTEAALFLKRILKKMPSDWKIKYKLAIVLSDIDPIEATKYLDELLEKVPQNIDYNIYGTTFMKAANIAELKGNSTLAKYYRYKIHSIDLLLNRKVIYKNDIIYFLENTVIKKKFFTYPLELTFSFINNSNMNIPVLKADFVLSKNNQDLETYTTTIANKEYPLYSDGGTSKKISVKFNKKIYTKKDLQNYVIKLYLYKDEKFKTNIAEVRIPTIKQ